MVKCLKNKNSLNVNFILLLMSVSLSTLLRHFGEKNNSEETYTQKVSPEIKVEKEEKTLVKKKIKILKKNPYKKTIKINFGKILYNQKFKSISQCLEYITFGVCNDKIKEDIPTLCKNINLNILIIKSNQNERIGNFNQKNNPVAVIVYQNGLYCPVSNMKKPPFFFSSDTINFYIKN